MTDAPSYPWGTILLGSNPFYYSMLRMDEEAIQYQDSLFQRAPRTVAASLSYLSMIISISIINYIRVKATTRPVT